MESEFIKVYMQVESMKAELSHYFSGYEEILNALIAQELNEEKIMLEIKKQIEANLAICVKGAMIKLVDEVIGKNKKLSTKLQKMSADLVKKL